MDKLSVHLGPRTYPIWIGENLLKKCGPLVRSATRARKFFLLSSPGIHKKYGGILGDSLEKSGCQVHPWMVPDGESHKNTGTLLNVLKGMAEAGLQRDSCLIALGGGVVGDLGGFAASVYMRGIDFANCPTTLLAQVDASVGGKTAVDFAGVKNLVGSFHQPKCVLIDPLVLRTLDGRQLRTGLAEVIKYGVICDEKLFSRIEGNLEDILEGEAEALVPLIRSSCSIKAQIVSEDEKENGKRAWLNYGHTLGHALESYFNYRVLTHGEAIAYGMWFAALLSLRTGLCTASTVERQRRLLERAGLFRPLPRLDPSRIFAKMSLDKKARKGRILFVLTRKIGLVTIRENVPKSAVLWALHRIRSQPPALPIS